VVDRVVIPSVAVIVTAGKTTDGVDVDGVDVDCVEAGCLFPAVPLSKNIEETRPARVVTFGDKVKVTSFVDDPASKKNVVLANPR
jgi:hypothetical protein